MKRASIALAFVAVLAFGVPTSAYAGNTTEKLHKAGAAVDKNIDKAQDWGERRLEGNPNTLTKAAADLHKWVKHATRKRE